MNPKDKSRMKARMKELIEDLSAVRAAVLSNQRDASETQRSTLETRLFESWVVDRLAQTECRCLGLTEDLEELRQELGALRKSLPRPAKAAAPSKAGKPK
jgi:hypothetical protein